MKNQKKELSIKTAPVEIRVLVVDGKRMTKAVFDQMQITEPYDLYIFEESGNKFLWKGHILGWVMARSGHTGRWLIYAQDGTLKRIHKDKIKKYSKLYTPIGYGYGYLFVANRLKENRIALYNEDGEISKFCIRDKTAFWSEKAYLDSKEKWEKDWELLKEESAKWAKVEDVCNDFNSKIDDLFSSENQIFISI
jgi:hypothetical protein